VSIDSQRGFYVCVAHLLLHNLEASRVQATKQDSSISAKQLFVEFLQDHLGIEFQGFQSAFGRGNDLILFAGPYGSTLSVPITTMFEPRGRAREIVQQKIEASRDTFNRAIDAESLEAVDRFWRANSSKALSQTNIGRETARREAP
jgi:hypothetical protein